MSIPDFTVLCAVDREHLPELEIAWATWKRFKPELFDHSMLLMVDGIRPFSLPRCYWENADVIEWHWRPDLPQRERMLTSLVHAAKHVATPYFLKIDCDTIATAAGAWIDPAWFDDDPVWVASPWGYSKPADSVQRFDGWGDVTPWIRDFPRLNIPFDPAADRVKHPRMISWLQFGRTDWTRSMAALCGIDSGRLPIPSQDGFLSMCAARCREFTRTVRFDRYGWKHIGGGIDRLRREAEKALAKASVAPAGK